MADDRMKQVDCMTALRSRLSTQTIRTLLKSNRLFQEQAELLVSIVANDFDFSSRDVPVWIVRACRDTEAPALLTQAQLWSDLWGIA